MAAASSSATWPKVGWARFIECAVAVKVIHADQLELSPPRRKMLLERFAQEAAVLARLRSPSIVEVYDYDTEGVTPFLVMEFVDGQTLEGLFRQLRGRPLDPLVTARLLVQAADGLRAADHSTTRTGAVLDPTLVHVVETLLRKDPAERGGGPIGCGMFSWGYCITRACSIPRSGSAATSRSCPLTACKRQGASTGQKFAV